MVENTETVETETTQETPEIDSMETNIEEGFNDDPLSDAFANEDNILVEDEDEEQETKETVEEKKVETVETEEKETTKVETAEELTARITGLNQALSEERGKKRDAQQRVYDLTHGTQQQTTQEGPGKKEFDWTDPEKTMVAIEDNISQKYDKKFLDMSQAQCMARNDDFSEKYEVFKTMVQANPSIYQSMLAQPDPAQWAYDQATNQVTMQEFGNDPAAYKEKMKAEMKAEILSELKSENNNKIENLIQKTPLPPSANSMKGKITDAKAPVILDDPLSTIEAGNR